MARQLLVDLASKSGQDIYSKSFAESLDQQDPLKTAQDLFHIPLRQNVRPDGAVGHKDGNAIYLTGNSLGLQPKSLEDTLMAELSSWKKWGVQGHFRGENPWVSIDERPLEFLKELVGAATTSEIAVMGSLSSNIHILMVPFYRPTPEKFKIIIEDGAFPSDWYIASSQLSFHGFDPATALIQLKPREGERYLRTEDILKAIQDNKDQLALVLLPGVQYYTGQVLDIPTITKATHEVSAVSGWDLAHAAGNIELKLHEWDVDFACWCSYKYLNSGPGGIAGLFVHNKFDGQPLHRFAGWWGHDSKTRFAMDQPFTPIPGAFGFRTSNPSVLTTMALTASLRIYHDIGMAAFLQKQQILTGYLDLLLQKFCSDSISVITPEARGCQLSLVCLHPHLPPRELEERLFDEGVVCDVRGTVIRAAPNPFYNSFQDVFDFVGILQKLVS